LYQMSNHLAARDITQEFLFICDVIKPSDFVHTCILWMYVLHKDGKQKHSIRSRKPIT